MNQNCECWLKNELNDSFSFIKKEIYEDVEFEIYLDDYGQSYFLVWIDPITKELQEWGCGTYNDYHLDMKDIAAHVNRLKGE